MIDDLRINGLGVIDQAELSFVPGLTAITGETGAGKTMLLNSLGLILGASSDPAKVRRGRERASVDGSFVIAGDSPIVGAVLEAGGEVDRDGDDVVLTLSRTVPVNGRSRCFLGGRAVPRAIVEDIAPHLVTIHGQSDQMRLRTPSAQLAAVDGAGGERLARCRAAYDRCWADYHEAQERLANFEAEAANHGRQRLALTALVEAVSAVDPHAGEEDEIKAKIDVLDHLEERRSTLLSILSALSGGEEPGAIDLVSHAGRLLEKIQPDLASRATGLAAELAEISSAVSASMSDLEITESLDDLHGRRAELVSLGRTLGMSVDEALVEAERARQTLADMSDPDATRGELTALLEQSKDAVAAAGEKLHAERQRSASAMTERMAGELAELALGRASIDIRVEPAPPGPTGTSSVQFMLCPDPHTPALPLGQAASGGELSRVMLALELVMADLNPSATPTFVFDEIDAGVGGEAARAIGARLQKLGQCGQVIVVTHLAQVASWANHHIVVERGEESTRVRTLSEEERVTELARMLSGSTGLDSARRHAADLLAESNVAR